MPAKSKKKTIRRPKKRVRGKWRTGQALPKEKYEEVWGLFSKGKSRAAISRATGVSEPTVARCIDQGYPKRGLEPLKERLHRVRRQAMDIADRQATHTRAKIYRQAQIQLANAMSISILMTSALDNYRGKVTERSPDGSVEFERKAKDPKGHPMVMAWDPTLVAKHLKNFSRATGAVAQWREILEGMAPWGVGDDDKEFAGWTTEELEYFAETGELPDRLAQEIGLEDV